MGPKRLCGEDMASASDRLRRHEAAEGRTGPTAGQGESRSPAAPYPRVWVLAGQRVGDLRQMIALAEALGWPYETKQLTYSGWHRLPNVLIGPSLMSIDRRRSTPLTPPWPDLVISAAKRSVPAALWICAQSGGRTRLVHIGRPWAPLRLFNLVVTTPQYGLPARGNVLQCTMPLHGITPARLAEAADRWRDRLAHLPRPITTLLLGGNSPSYRFTRDAARRLAAASEQLAAATGGAVVVTSSSRTPPPVIDAVAAALERPAYIYRWRPDDPDNPYVALLALSDAFVVTGDSASLLSEACSTGRPVYIFDLPRRGPHLARRGGRFAARLAELGVIMPQRDMSQLHAALIARGIAARLGDAAPAGGRPPEEFDSIVARVRTLVQTDC